MSTIVEIPVSISLPAADCILNFGFWSQFKAMLDHASQAIPGLHSIAVSLDDQSRPGDPAILLVAEVDGFPASPPEKKGETTEWQWDRWVVESFPPDVLRRFSLMIVPSEDFAIHGG